MSFDHQQYKHEWYLRNKEKTIQRTAERRKANPDCRKEEYRRHKERSILGIGVEEYRRTESERAVKVRRRNPSKALHTSARNSAKLRGLEFTIAVDDIEIPEMCPVLGIPLMCGAGKLHANSPSIDRIDTTKGYVPGNIWVISWRANRIKSDSTLAELKMLVAALEQKASASALSDQIDTGSWAVAA